MARNKYPEETVKLILDVSTKMFCEKGYDNTSLQDIIMKQNFLKVLFIIISIQRKIF